MTQRARSYCFTINNYTLEEEEYVKKYDYSVKYMIVGKEVGAQGTPHLQGFIEFKNARQFNSVKEDFPRAHLEVAKGNALHSKKYCSKDGNLLVEKGTPPKPGKRTDMLKIKDAVLSDGKVPIDLTNNPQQLRFAENLLKYYRRPEKYLKKTVIWIHGATGQGKTRKAMELVSDSYWKWNHDYKWFDGYQGDDFVILDELRQPTELWEWQKLLCLLDGYPLQVQVKGGFLSWNPKTVIITAPYPPSNVEVPGEDNMQLIRRIDTIIAL